MLFNKKILCFGGAVLALAACTKESVVRQPVRADETTFVVSAAGRGSVSTRAIDEGGYHDNDVREVAVMLFDAATHKYVKSVQAYALSKLTTGGIIENQWTFTAKIPANGSFEALFFANAAEVINANLDLATAKVKASGEDMLEMTIDQIENTLIRVISDKYNANPALGDYKPFVMASKRTPITMPLADANHFAKNPVRLMRDVAKINVSTSDAVRGQFTIDEIRLCYRNAASFIVGTPTLWEQHNRDVMAPLFDASAARTAGMVLSGTDESKSECLVYKDEIKDNACIDEIFIPECPRDPDPTANVCLLVSGTMAINGNTTPQRRWFKLMMVREDAAGNDVLINVLRNYSYTFHITSISDSGYSTPEDAFAGTANNIEADLLVEDDGLNNIVHNGHHYLGVTKTTYTFGCLAEVEQELKIVTNHPDGWRMVLPAGGWPSWAGTPPAAAAAEGVTTSDAIRPDANNNDRWREFSFTVWAGSMSHTITLSQRPNIYIFATPGVLGIRQSDLRRLFRDRVHMGNMAHLDPNIELSLKGSSTYAGTIVDKPAVTAEFGGLEGEPVYVVCNMFGSTVALLMGRGENWENDGRRVVWTNPEYDGNTVGPWRDPTTFTPCNAVTLNTDNDIVDNPRLGHGDICRAATNGAYRTPAGNPWRLDDGTTPFGIDKFQDIGDVSWWTLPQTPDYFSIATPTYVHTGLRNYAMLASKDGSIFLPAAGSINFSGFNAALGIIFSYRTSTALIFNNAQKSYVLGAAPNYMNPQSEEEIDHGMPVRCVKTNPGAVVP